MTKMYMFLLFVWYSWNQILFDLKLEFSGSFLKERGIPKGWLGLPYKKKTLKLMY